MDAYNAASYLNTKCYTRDLPGYSNDLSARYGADTGK